MFGEPGLVTSPRGGERVWMTLVRRAGDNEPEINRTAAQARDKGPSTPQFEPRHQEKHLHMSRLVRLDDRHHMIAECPARNLTL